MASRDSHSRVGADAILVVGLGLFGSAVARTLVEMKVEVLATAEDPELVARYADELTHVVQVDSTDREALEQIGVRNFRKAVVALSQVEKSIMTVLLLHEAGIPEIWARAATREHGAILERIGAHHVIFSEASTGRRVAHAAAGHMADYFEFADGFAIARTRAPRFTWNKPINKCIVRAQHKVTVVGVKRAGTNFRYAEPETVIHRDDELVVAGATSDVDRFCNLG